MKILETIKGVKVGTDGYGLEEFEKPDGGDVAEKVKQKVIYTGPLSAVTTPTPLIGGESFDDWDFLFFQVSTTSDVDIAGSGQTLVFSNVAAGVRGVAQKAVDTGGSMFIDILSSTTFQIVSSTLLAQNIQRIIGIKL